MAMEVLTTWNPGEVDTDGDITYTKYSVYAVGMANNATDGQFYNDYGADHFGASWTHYFTAECDKASAATGYYCPWMLSQAIGKWTTMIAAGGHLVLLYFADTGAAMTLVLRYRSGAVDVNDSVTISEDYRFRPLYFKVVKSGDVITAYVYREPARTTLLYGGTTGANALTVTDASVSDDNYRYLWLCNASGVADADEATGRSGELYLDEVPPSIFTETRACIPFDADDVETFAPAGVWTTPTVPATNADLTWTTGVTGHVHTSASADDCRVYYKISTSTWTFLNDTLVWAGDFTAADAQQAGGGMRFPGLNIPGGATILSAYIRFTAESATIGDSCKTKLCAELDKTAAQFSNIADYQARRGTDCGGANNTHRTVAEVSWEDVADWADEESGADTTSPDLSTIIQEVVDMDAATLEDLVIFWDDHDDLSTHGAYRSAHSFDSAAAKAPYIVINYVVKSPAWTNHPHSIGLHGVHDLMDNYCYFTPSLSVVLGGTMEADIMIPVGGLEVNGWTMLLGFGDKDAPTYAVAYVQNDGVAGQHYFRLGKYQGAWDLDSTNTLIPCVEGTTYHVELVANPGGGSHAWSGAWYYLLVNGKLVEHMAYAGAAPDRCFIGSIEAGGTAMCGGTRYIDNVRYLNDTVAAPHIARGGLSDTILVYSCVKGERLEHDYFYSTDNMKTRPIFATQTYSGPLVWNPNGDGGKGSWWIFTVASATDGYGGTDYMRHCKAYEITTSAASWEVTDWLTDVTFTLKKDFDEWFTGTHTGAEGAGTLSDDNANNGAGWAVNSLVGCTIINVTDSSRAVITANTAFTVTAALADGGRNHWDSVVPDHYHIQKTCLIFPSRELDANGDLLVGLEYLNWENALDYTISSKGAA